MEITSLTPVGQILVSMKRKTQEKTIPELSNSFCLRMSATFNRNTILFEVLCYV